MGTPQVPERGLDSQLGPPVGATLGAEPFPCGV